MAWSGTTASPANTHEPRTGDSTSDALTTGDACEFKYINNQQ
jgi:hypothetical protein